MHIFTLLVEITCTKNTSCKEYSLEDLKAVLTILMRPSLQRTSIKMLINELYMYVVITEGIS